jgi:UDP-N-acetylglucosamine acyltransferase
MARFALRLRSCVPLEISKMIDPKAVIDPAAEIDENVTIGPFTVIGPGVRIGAGTNIGSHVVIKGETTIGRDNRFFQFSSIGENPQDKKYAGEVTYLTIGDNNVFREFCTVNRGTTQDGGLTSIGSDNLFMAYTHVAHDCHIGDHIIMANAASLGGHVHIGDWAILGGFSMVHQFGRIGAHAFCGMGSVINKDVPPYVMVNGQPVKPHGINSEGLKRRDFSDEQILAIKRAYKTLYTKGLRLSEATEVLREMAANESALKPFLDFIDLSDRTIVR